MFMAIYFEKWQSFYLLSRQLSDNSEKSFLFQAKKLPQLEFSSLWTERITRLNQKLAKLCGLKKIIAPMKDYRYKLFMESQKC